MFFGEYILYDTYTNSEIMQFGEPVIFKTKQDADKFISEYPIFDTHTPNPKNTIIAVPVNYFFESSLN